LCNCGLGQVLVDIEPKLKYSLVGQDPYHGHNQAHGLCFSVERRVAIPPSLRNIFKEISDDPAAVTEGKFEVPTHGNLEAWAQQGVFLLNASLTVREGEANSHATMWASFTDEVIRGISERSNAGVVFLLWGGFARKKRTLVDTSRHRVIEAPHPSPLSASRGWFGSGVFSKCNVELQALGHKPIDWRVPV
jgi:uracil-DNA glycosylase